MAELDFVGHFGAGFDDRVAVLPSVSVVYAGPLVGVVDLVAFHTPLVVEPPATASTRAPGQRAVGIGRPAGRFQTRPSWVSARTSSATLLEAR